MPQAPSVRTIVVVLLSAALVFVGNGLFQTMLPIRAEREAFSTGLIGLLGAAYFGGFIAGCLIGPRLIQAVGHIRAYAGVTSVLAAVTLVFPIWVSAEAWVFLRFLTGLCLAVAVMGIESWLNDQASNETRGRMLSAYLIVTNSGWIAGQLGVNVADLMGPVLFILVAIAIALSVAPVALTPTAEPDPVPDARLDLGGLVRLSPVGTLGAFLVGLSEGAFWSLGPLFGQMRGLEVFEITLLMGAFVLGGTLSQWPIGRWSDRRDRRTVILIVASATMLTGVAIAGLSDLSFPAMLALAAAHGALMIPIYALCMAHVNDRAPPDRFVQVSGGLLLVYALGATLGPVLAAPVMEAMGPGGLFLFVSGALGLLGVFIAVRMLAAGQIRRAYPIRFQPLPRTTQSIYEMEAGNDPPE